MPQLPGIEVQVSADLSALERAAGRISGILEGVGQKLESIGGDLTARLTLPMVAFGAASLRAAAQTEALEKGLRAVMGEGADVRAELKRLEQTAALPGLGFTEAVQGSVRLQAVGFSAEGARRAMESFGNAIATVGGGRAELDGTLLALTQIAAKGKVSAEEINQLQERVPQIRAAMLAAFGTADTEALGKRGIGAEQFIEGIIAEFERLPRVTGGLGNAFENFADAATRAFSKAGDAINKAFNVEGLLGRAASAMERLGGAIERVSEANPGLARMGLAIAAAAAAAGPLLFALGSVAKLGGILAAGFAAATGPIGLTAAAIVGAGAAITALYQRSESFRATVAAVWGSVRESIVQAMDAAAAAVGDALAAMQRFWETYGDKILRVASLVFSQVARAVGGIVAQIGNIVSLVLNVLTGNFAGAFDALKRIVLTNVKVIGGAFLTWIETMIVGAQTLAEKVPFFGDALGGAFGGAADAVARLRSRLDSLGTSAGGGGAAAVMNTLTESASGLADLFRGGVTPALGAAGKAADAFHDRIRSGAGVFASYAEAAADALGKAKALVDTSVIGQTSAKDSPFGRTRLQTPDDLSIDKAAMAEANAAMERLNVTGSQVAVTMAQIGEITERTFNEGLRESVDATFAGLGNYVSAAVVALGDMDKVTGNLRRAWVSLGDTLKRILAQFVADLIAAQLRLLAFKVLANFIAPGSGGALGSLMGSLAPSGVSASASTVQVVGQVALRGSDALILIENAAGERQRQGYGSTSLGQF